jgi:hypothetical protein
MPLKGRCNCLRFKKLINFRFPGTRSFKRPECN